MIQDIPKPFDQTQIIELAQVFIRRLGRPRTNDLEASGFNDISGLLLSGLIMREPGRYSIGFQPGEDVAREMWQLNPSFCSAIRLPIPPPKERVLKALEGI